MARARVSIVRPSAVVVQRFIEKQRRLDLTYERVRSTRAMPSDASGTDFAKITVGSGAGAFAASCAALAQWDHFRLGWVEPCAPLAPIRPGAVAAVAIRAMGVWWLNAARIVYVIDEDGPISRFGYAYGTLPGHAESGEERFLIEWDHVTDDVNYSILAFSRPRHWLARIGRPLVRRLQHRFRHDSLDAMRRTVRANRTNARFVTIKSEQGTDSAP